MKNLSDNWITEGWVDFEYKKYVLLAYLQHVNQSFKEVKLYPPLADLIHHYSRLKSFVENRNQFKDAFPKLLKSPDFDQMKFHYQSLIIDDEMMQHLEEIVDFSLVNLKHYIEEGKNIYDFLENEMKIESVGVTPLYQKEGYAMLSNEHSKDVFIYRYKISLFQNNNDSFKGIMMDFIKKTRRSIVNTLENLKLELMRTYQDLPTPATYNIHSYQAIPLDESFLPISKRLLLKELSK
jgi:hypothetical protein